MKAVNQTKDHSVCLYGETLPKYALYGCVYNTVWYCNNFNKITISAGKYAYEFYAYNPKTGRFEKTATTSKKYNGGAIFCRIRDYIKSPDFINMLPEKCTYKNFRKEENFRAVKRAEQAHSRVIKRENRELLENAPKIRKVNYHYIPMDNTAYELRKQNSDNCDFGGGGDAVMRHDHKDGITKCNMSLQYIHETKRTIEIYDTKTTITRDRQKIKIERTDTLRKKYTEITDKTGTKIK